MTKKTQREIEVAKDFINVKKVVHANLKSALAEYAGLTDEQSNNIIGAICKGKIFELKIVY